MAMPLSLAMLQEHIWYIIHMYVRSYSSFEISGNIVKPVKVLCGTVATVLVDDLFSIGTEEAAMFEYCTNVDAVDQQRLKKHWHHACG